MKSTSLKKPISFLALLRFSLSMINFILINYYASNKYIRKFSHENKAYLSIFENSTKFNDIYQFYGALYEDIKYQNQYFIDVKKYHNYYLINNSSVSDFVNYNNNKITDAWDARQLNDFSLSGYVRYRVELDFIYALLNLRQDEKIEIDRIIQYESKETCFFSKENSIVEYIMSVSESENYLIYFWMLGETDILQPYPLKKQRKFCSASVTNAHWRFDLLITNNTEFELIEMVGFKKGIPEADIPPFVDTLSYGRFIIYVYLEFCLNLPLALISFIISIMMPELCAYTTSLATNSESHFRNSALNLILCFFIWNVVEFQHNFDANMLLVSRQLSNQPYVNTFCTLPLMLETHFFLKMTQLAFVAACLTFFAMIPATLFLKESFLQGFCITIATLLVFYSIQLYTIANEFKKSCGYDFYKALYYTAMSNFFVSSKQPLTLLLNGSILKIIGEILCMIQIFRKALGFNFSILPEKLLTIIPIDPNNFLFFKKKNSELITSEMGDFIRHNKRANPNEIPSM